MSLFNKAIKGFFYICIQLWLIVQVYLLGVLTTGCILSIAMAILSAVNFIPAILIYRFWLVLLVGSIPLGIVYYCIVIFDFITRYTNWKKREKESK